MALLDTASLIVTPNGYKASKLYSIVPSDGTGDMTFSRTGNTATRVNSSGLIETVNANIPRLDYLDGTCPKLLMEPQRTNLFLRSEELQTSPWNTLSTSTITANAITSPDGTTDADKLVENTASGGHFVYQPVVLANSTDYTFSIFVKAAERTLVQMRIQAKTTVYTDNINLTTGVATSGTMTSYGNGWWRYSRTVNSGTGSTEQFLSPWLRDTSGATGYTGDGTSGIYLWGAQCEAGAYATSYIPTTTASVTRNADFSNKTSISALLNASQGTILLKGIFPYDSTYLVILDITDSSDSNRIQFLKLSNLGIRFRLLYPSGSVNIDYTLPNVLSTYTMVAKYSASQISLFINGVLIGTNTGGTTSSTLNAIAFGQWWQVITSAKVEKLAYWKTALSDSECLTLSQS